MLYIQTQILVLALLLIWPSKILTLLKAQFSHLQNQVKCNHTAHFYCALCVFTLSSIIKFIYHLFNKCVGDIYCEDEDHKNKAGKSTLEKVKHISDIAMTTTSAITVQLLSNRNSIIFKVRLTHTHTHTQTLIVVLYHSWYNQTLLQPYNRFSLQSGLLGLPLWLSW